MFMKKDNFQLWLLIFIVNSLSQSESSILNCKKQFGACQCHESYTKYNVNKYIQNVCYKVFDSTLTWDEASAACKREHSYILDWLSENSSPHLELLNKGINVLWLGIRRLSGFYVKQSFDPQLFKESKKLWGKKWKESVPLYDCVALNISSGLLSTHDCNTALPFICQNNQFPSQPIESLACRNHYFFSYQLPLSNENCIQIFSPAPFSEAQRICSGSGGVLASENVYSNVKYFENISETLLSNVKSFWLKNGTALCNLVGNECNKMQEHSFVCVQEAQNYVIIPKILPNIMESFPSTDSKSNLLTCDVKVNGKSTTGKENLIYYQWYKNGIPISVHTSSFDVRFYTDPVKRRSSPVIHQGIYCCDVQILGSIKSFRSEDVNYFYSDVSTYLMIINGSRNEKDRDFSQQDFRNWQLDLNKSVSVITMDMQTRFHDFSWDFHNISFQGNHTTVTLLLYINQSATFQSNYFSETDIFEDLMAYKDSIQSLSHWHDVSLSIQNAAYCFEEEKSISHSSFNGTLLWKNSGQTKNAVSEPLCLNSWKLQRRQCIPSFVTGAHWAPFNYSQCTRYQLSVKRWNLQTRYCKPSFIIGAHWSPFNYTLCSKYQPSIKNLEIQCPVGFSLLNHDICFKVYEDGHMWNNAQEICSNSSSYISDSYTLKEIANEATLGPLSYWLPVKILHNNIQWFGMKPESEWKPMQRLLALKSERENVLCATVNQSLNAYGFNFELCCEKKAFVCIQQPIKIFASIMFSRTWTKISQSNNCYYSDPIKKTWAEANETCEILPVNSSLLHSIQDLDVYYNFKLHFRKLAPTEKVTYWWINLMQENNELKWLPTVANSVEYVDWDSHTDFNLQKSGGLLMLDSSYDNNIQWTLKDLSSQEASLCEMQNCPDLGSTYTYIEDRTISNEIPEEDYSKFISKTDMHCVPSGWFLLNSISWYKDGDFITSGNNHSKLPLSVKFPTNIKDAVKFQGYYWCSVDSVYPLKRIFSPKVLYRLPGIYTFLLYIQIISNELLPSCSEFVSKFKLSHDILTFLNESLPDGFLHADPKNISCYNKSLSIYLYFKMGLKSEENMLKDIKTALDLNEASTKDYIKKRFINENIQVTARSTVACSRDNMVLNEKNITWPSTSIGEVTLSEEMCVTEKGTAMKRQCVGDFSVGAFWDSISGKCVEIHSDITVNLHKLSVSKITEENVLNTSLSLKMLTSTPENLCIADIQYVAQILKHMAGIPSVNPDVLDNILSTLDHLMEIQYQMESIALYQTNASSEISLALENILSNVHTSNQAVKLSSNNIAVSLVPLNLSESKFSTGGILKSWDMNVTVLYNGTKQLNKKFETFEAGIMLPDSLLIEKYNENTKNLAIVIRQSFYFAPNIEILSPQIDVFLGNEQIYDVDPPIEMVFKLSQKGSISKVSHYKCAYWDQQLNENFGGWSYKGCFSKLIDNNKMQCLCDHLTSFAVILEMKPGNEYLKVHQLTLSIITYIGCSLSILGLTIIILTFIFFRKWRKDVKNKVLFNLSLALISFLIILLSGIENQSSKYGCFAVAIFLHYFMLASFTWMLVEAVIQYLSFVKVIGTYIPCFMQKAMIFAWGMPFIIVVIVSSIDYRHYISRTKYCWLSGDIFYYAVAAPVLAMLTMNFLTFALVLYSNTCGRPNKHLRSNQSERREIITTAKAMFCVSVLLGLSWIFGFLAIDGAKLLFQYLFAGTATLQGFLMCVFFVFRQKSSRDLWTNLISPVTTPDVSRASHVTGMTDITNRVINNHSRQNTPDRFSRAVYKARLSYIMFN